jgi:hypothetical protein
LLQSGDQGSEAAVIDGDVHDGLILMCRSGKSGGYAKGQQGHYQNYWY